MAKKRCKKDIEVAFNNLIEDRVFSDKSVWTKISTGRYRVKRPMLMKSARDTAEYARQLISKEFPNVANVEVWDRSAADPVQLNLHIKRTAINHHYNRLPEDQKGDPSDLPQVDFQEVKTEFAPTPIIDTPGNSGVGLSGLYRTNHSFTYLVLGDQLPIDFDMINSINKMGKAIEVNPTNIEVINKEVVAREIITSDFLGRQIEFQLEEVDGKTYLSLDQLSRESKLASMFDQIIEREEEVNENRRNSEFESQLTTFLDRKNQEKLDVLKKAFPGSVVILDTHMDVSGRLLGSKAPAYESMVSRGEIEQGTPVIAINPNLIQSDTISHEYAHLYIELLGNDNVYIQNAIRGLRDTDLWTETKSNYPELSDERLSKEVLAQALGMEINELMESGVKETVVERIHRILARILEEIARIVGVDSDAVKKLARQSLNTNDLVDTDLPYYSQDQRPRKFTASQNKRRISEDQKDFKVKVRLPDGTTIDNRIAIEEMNDYQLEAVGRKLGIPNLNLVTLQNEHRRLAGTKYTAYKDIISENTVTGLLKDDTDSKDIVGDQAERNLLARDFSQGEILDMREANDPIWVAEVASIQLMWDAIANVGTVFHNEFEKYLTLKPKKYNISHLSVDNQKMVQKLFDNLDDFLKDNYDPTNGDQLLTEQHFWDPISKTVGKADMIILHTDGSHTVVDFKFTTNWIKIKEEKAAKQLKLYSNMIANKFGSFNRDLFVLTYNINHNEDAFQGRLEDLDIRPFKNNSINAKTKDNFIEISHEVNKVIPITQASRIDFTETELTKAADTIESLIKDIDLFVTQFRGKSNRPSDVNIEFLEKTLNNLRGVSERAGMFEFIRYGAQRMKAIENHISRASFAREGKDRQKEILVEYSNEMKLYAVIDDIVSTSDELGFFTDENFNVQGVVRTINEINDVRSALRNRIDNKLRDYLIDELIQSDPFIGAKEYVNRFRNEFFLKHKPSIKKAKIVVDYNGADISESQAVALMKQFTKEQFNKYSDEIISHRRKYFDRYLRQNKIDIKKSDVARTALFLNNHLIQYSNLLFDQRDIKIRQQTRQLEQRLEPVLKNLKHTDAGEILSNPQKFYKKYIAHDANGNPTEYYRGEIKGEVIVAYHEMIEQRQKDRDEKGISWKDSRKKYREWADKYFKKDGSIKDAYKDKEYDPKDPLQKIINEANQLINGMYIGSSKNAVQTITVNKILHDFQKLPSVSKSWHESIVSANADQLYEAGSIAKNAYYRVKEALSVNSDEVGFYDNSIHQTGDGNTYKNVPVYYDGHLGGSRESHLANVSYNVVDTLILNFADALTYKNSKDIESDVLLLQEVATSSAQKIERDTDETPRWTKRLRQITDQRYYRIGRTSSINNRTADNIVRGMLRIQSVVGLYGNITADTINVLQGSISTLHEVVGGDLVTLADAKYAGAKYSSDAREWTQDVFTRFTPQSSTGLLYDLFLVDDEFGAKSGNFTNDNVFKRVFNGALPESLRSGGERLMRSMFMYSALNTVKITNNNGEYLNSEGNVVEKPDEALSLGDAYDRFVVVQQGKENAREVNYDDLTDAERAYVIKTPYLKLKPWIQNTTAGKPNEKRFNAHISQKIKERLFYIHGVYDQRYKPELQRSLIGSALLQFRGWLIPGIDRRFQGAQIFFNHFNEYYTLDEMSQELADQYTLSRGWDNRPAEGFVTSTFRMLRKAMLVRSLSKVKDQMLEERLEERYGLKSDKLGDRLKFVWLDAGETERSNVKRFASEAATIAITGTALAILRAMEGEEDEEFLLSYWHALLLLRRLESELLFNYSYSEAYKIIKNPFTVLSVIGEIQRLISNTVGLGFNSALGLDTDQYYYQRKAGQYDKGDWKGLKNVHNLIPLYKHFTRNFKDSYEWLESNSVI